MTICVAGIAPAAAQLESDAFTLARQSGQVIGAATSCGLASDRAVVVWKRILAAGTSGPNAVPERDFTVVHSEAVRTADIEQRRKGKGACKIALNRFRELEDFATIRR